ncbi:protein-tyrosine phosphatase-like protein [Gorgonomyces haynaldii]|nr:protein-tyrosine phosphatase-like protein [Gorgonomyces haynaldii]
MKSTHGNFALCSCPGKKIRLDGPMNGKASISRSLEQDFNHIASFGVKVVICMLNNSELKYLGVEWKQYVAQCEKHKIQVLRLPLTDGAAPASVLDMESIFLELEKKQLTQETVLCHCRGGIGRAGLVACCFLIRNGYFTDAWDAIDYVRRRRSPKAIETRKQEDFIQKYCEWIQKNE